MKTIVYKYSFKFPSGREETFCIRLDAHSLTPLDKPSSPPPDWTRLEFKQCENCPLEPSEDAYCPLAVNLVDLVTRMGDVVSYDEVYVTVNLDDRQVVRSSTAQEGISSLMGLITATSGCPHTIFFKPMARFHLPFATAEETCYRVATMYMLAQYFRWQNDLEVDLDLDYLQRFYTQVAKINHGIAERLRAEKREDGTVNALVLLDMYVKSVPHTIKDTLATLSPLFEQFLTPHRSGKKKDT